MGLEGLHDSFSYVCLLSDLGLSITLASCMSCFKISRKVTLGDHMFNSHDLWDWITIDIKRRNLMLITVRA